MNQGFIAPLGERELGGIVKSVVRYQRRNLESGKQQQTFSFIQSCRGKSGGKKSGQARRTKTAERDAGIHSGHAQAVASLYTAVAREYGLNRYAIAVRTYRQEGGRNEAKTG